MNKTYKAFLALSVLLLMPASTLCQEKWTRSEKTDALRGTSSTRFTLDGKFLEAPQQGRTSSPTLVVDCDPSKSRFSRLLHAYIVVGTVLDAKVGLGNWGTVVSGLEVQYRLDDGKVKSESLSHSTDFSAIFLDAKLHGFLYSNKSLHKENLRPVKKVVIQVSEYLGGHITMEFDFPDPTEVADTCGLF